ncbi:MAG: hypothetical protein ACLFUY_01805 [Desulfobacterales bacterium]
MPAHRQIGLIMATYLEAKPFVKGFQWKRSEDAPFPAYQGSGLVLVISGMGKANAAAACAWLCTTREPGCIINLGAAGANSTSLTPGSIHHIREVRETDRCHFKTGEPLCHRPHVMAGFSTVRLATRDEPVIDPKERLRFSNLAELSDMEGAAIIHTARRFQTPCYVFKFVSDTPEHTTGSQIAANIREFREHVFNFFAKELHPAYRRSGTATRL